ncbi:uncharacterized protein LOC122231272 [Panthera tigris]|uniref:uncharacterized protein LOC122231272 n=1 Tax=Panthera tigris TaxID=9694 RepID=UPI001C6FA1A0|nr:uncharacterized protein LOC122231272 [Panthera tigris]
MAAGPPAPSPGGRRGSDLFLAKRRLSPWLFQAPQDLPLLSLYDLAVAFSAFLRRAHRRAASAHPDPLQRKAWTSSLSHPPTPGAHIWVSGVGWPCAHGAPQTSSPDVAQSGLASLASSLRSSPVSIYKSAVSTQPIPAILRPSLIFSHFFPLLEFDSNSPQNRVCTKAATRKLDLPRHCIVFLFFVFLIALTKYTLCSQLGGLQGNDVSTIPPPPLGFSQGLLKAFSFSKHQKESAGNLFQKEANLTDRPFMAYLPDPKL